MRRLTDSHPERHTEATIVNALLKGTLTDLPQGQTTNKMNKREKKEKDKGQQKTTTQKTTKTSRTTKILTARPTEYV